jgi:hypothetical protein
VNRFVDTDGLDKWWYGPMKDLTFVFHQRVQVLWGPVIAAAFGLTDRQFSFHEPQFFKYWVGLQLASDTDAVDKDVMILPQFFCRKSFVALMDYFGWKRGLHYYMVQQPAGKTLMTLSGVEHMVSLEQRCRGDEYGITTEFVSSRSEKSISVTFFDTYCLMQLKDRLNDVSKGPWGSYRVSVAKNTALFGEELLTDAYNVVLNAFVGLYDIVTSSHCGY